MRSSSREDAFVAMRLDHRHLGACVLFFLSGAAGLIYQVVWVRRFAAVFGNTVQSASLVTGVFLCGLGVGSYFVGRWSDRLYRRDPAAPLRWYGYSELTIALLGVALIWLLPRLGPLSVWLSAYRPGAHGWLHLSAASYAFRFVLAILTLAPPCLVMGGTLSLLIRFVVSREVEGTGWRVGLLYGLNTAGAALGALLTDFALVPLLGLQSTQLAAVALNVAAGLGALWLGAHRTVARAAAAPPEPPHAATAAPAADRVVVFTALALFLTGFAAMGIEIVWFRFLSQILGSLRAVFSLLLAAMLVGMWIGSTLGGYVHRRLGRAPVIFALGQAALVLSVLGLLGLLDHRGSQSAFMVSIGPSFMGGSASTRAGLELWCDLRPILIVTGLPSVLMGFAFPLGNATAQRAADSVGVRAGVLYLATTLGNVLGAWLTGFVLLPALGIRLTVLGLGCCAAASILPTYGAWRAGQGAKPNRGPRIALAGSLLCSLLALFGFARLDPLQLLQPSLPPGNQGGSQRLLTYSEGLNETLAIAEVPGLARVLFTNGHPMSGTGANESRYMRAFAHIPLLQLAEPESVLVICFGVGNTLNAASLHPSVRRLEIADLSEQVLDHARYFAATNGNVLADPRTLVFVNDGRHHLLMQPPDSYDLVTLEPPPISFAGVASLYSQEFYQLVRSRLRRGGFITQWLPGYQVPGDTVRSMVAAFIEVFPESVLLSGDDKNLILMGRRDEALSIDPGVLAARIAARPAVRADLERIGMAGPLELVGSFVASYATMRQATRSAPVLTDDRPVLEYSRLSGIRATELPADLFDVSGVGAWCPACLSQVAGLPSYLGLLGRIYHSPAYLHAGVLAAVASDTAATDLPQDAATRAIVARSRYLERLLSPPGWATRQAGLRWLAGGQLPEALATLKHAVYLDPTDVDSLAALGQAYEAAEQSGDSADVFRMAVELGPGRSDLRVGFARALRKLGQLDAAQSALEQALALDPADADAHYELAATLKGLKQLEASDRELDVALDLDPWHAKANLVLCKRALDKADRAQADEPCAAAVAGGADLSPTLWSSLPGG